MELSNNVYLMESYIVEKIWGGRRIAHVKNLEVTDNIGESWEVSTLDEGQSRGGPGRDLSTLLGGRKASFVVKLLDTTDNLSVQVHPNESYAQDKKDIKAKTECWLILDADEGSGIYLGLKEGVELEQFFESATKGEPLQSMMNFFPVASGDFFVVPAGIIHAIGKGVFLAEVQQASGITYRVWDWNRVDSQGRSRELHLTESRASALGKQPSRKEDFGHLRVDRRRVHDGELLYKHQDYSIRYYTMGADSEMNISLHPDYHLYALTVIDGALSVDGQEVDQFRTAIVERKGVDLIVLKSSDQPVSFIWVEGFIGE